ncbi:hypothetical protein [Marinifilum caeruleilacunae]|uniref:DUF3823 domain-containing protein n=1 Tax=Marinifilum caeruleilacunae TaxID=2499076 RepID=A0ABX1WS63_9BACT|nr:hypothetical protein [Marinifilum caeruleilacunae]NOU58933.1 hypothetical protein [Marinifilum caeruleilacunae]
MNNLKAIGALLILAVGFVSCDSDDFDNTPEKQAIADVFVRVQKSGDDTVYAPVFYTYSNFDMQDVSVEGPDASGIDKDLAKYTNKMVFRSMPVQNDFSTDDVENGVYQFDITAADLKTYTISDKLLEGRLDPVEITEFNYDKLIHSIQIAWESVEDRDVYVVKIHNQIDGEIIYVSDRMISTNHRVISGTDNWTDFDLVEGQSYVVGVYAYKFELPSATSGYDINCESVAYREIEW